MSFECAYCGKKVPDSIEPAFFACCGEVGHTEFLTGGVMGNTGGTASSGRSKWTSRVLAMQRYSDSK